MSDHDGTPRVLWLTPDKPENISVGRLRIVDAVEEFDIDMEPANVRTAWHAIQANPPYELFVGTTRSGAILGAVLSKILRKPLLVDHVDPIRQFEETHSRWLAVVVRRLEMLAFSQSAHTLYVYSEEAGRVERNARASTNVDLGVDYERFANPHNCAIQDAQDRLTDLGLRDNVAVYIGGLEPIYNIRELMAAMDHLTDWSLIVLGTGSLANQVTAAAEGSNSIFYLGTVSHEAVPGYLHTADVGVSLVDDPHTLKVIEYGAAGLPVVQLAGRAEKRFGNTVEYCEDDPQSIARAIRRAAAEGYDQDLRELARRQSWQEIATKYSEVMKAHL